jgi:hypothetical protein
MPSAYEPLQDSWCRSSSAKALNVLSRSAEKLDPQAFQAAFDAGRDGQLGQTVAY